MLELGFGFVEIGSVTPRPQQGNPRPRLFRLAEDRGVINRMGFNGQGLDAVLAAAPRGRAAASSASMSAPTRTAPIAPPIMSTAARRWRKMPTISSATSRRPTRRDCANCRARAARQPAEEGAGRHRRKPVPLLVKIAPDATDDDLDDIVGVCRDMRMDGMIVGNTTLSRPATLRSPRRDEAGGLSGPPLMPVDRSAAQDGAARRAAVPAGRLRRHRLGRRRLREDPRRRDAGAALFGDGL